MIIFNKKNITFLFVKKTWVVTLGSTLVVFGWNHCVTVTTVELLYLKGENRASVEKSETRLKACAEIVSLWVICIDGYQSIALTLVYAVCWPSQQQYYFFHRNYCLFLPRKRKCLLAGNVDWRQLHLNRRQLNHNELIIYWRLHRSMNSPLETKLRRLCFINKRK